MGDSRLNAKGLLLYCRAGFEGECAQEIAALAAARDLHGHVRAQRDSGVVEYVLAEPADAIALTRQVETGALIFARQCIVIFAQLQALPAHDRLTPILAALRAAGLRFADAFVEGADTNEGKALAPFCRSFGSALIGAMKRTGLLDAASPHRLHAFFSQSDKVSLCVAEIGNSAPWPQGIPRLKFPREAPSRSTLKLDEAFLVLMSEGERTRWLRAGMSAVDLGAAPGGWTWQLVRRSVRVTAVDNGPMDPALLDSGLVTHLRADGFRFQPKKAVDWLVCDMVEQPRRVAELIAHWLGQRWCRRAIFNLKLPMKKRYEETLSCLGIVGDALGGRADIRAKQLYHDREEITVFVESGG
jgi:23S rRNA (cytidine2498-2'-O)-methyltransferase